MEANIGNLYNANDVKHMQIADASRLPGKDRVQEIAAYARNMGYKKIGVAHCLAVQKEAEALRQILEGEFEVILIDCKCNKIPSSTFLGEGAKGVSCNPAGQALFLDEQKTEMNIVMGLCIGHDMIFSAKSTAPTTTLLVKDRAHSDNPKAIFKKE